MHTIWKLSFHTTDEIVAQLPTGAILRAVQVQPGGDVVAGLEPVSLWFECDTDAPRQKRRLVIYGTGHKMRPIDPVFEQDRFGEYVGTYQQAGGALVFHVYDLGPVQ